MIHFYSGPAGTGKTTQATHTLHDWLHTGVDPNEILVLVPQRSLAIPYLDVIRNSQAQNALDAQVVTFNGLGQRALSLYWSSVAERAIPNWDGREPTFLTIETAQYYMRQFLDPVLEQGYFDSISLDPPRIIEQILSNLAASAVNGFTLEDVRERLVTAWNGHSSRITVYDAAIRVATDYRSHCLKNALLDFSLQVNLYTDYLLKDTGYYQTLLDRTRYILMDNIEENYPVAIHLMHELCLAADHALIIHDTDAGFRLFLGASPQFAESKLRTIADDITIFESFVERDYPIQYLEDALDRSLSGMELIDYDEPLREAFNISFHTFFPQMIDWVVSEAKALSDRGVRLSEVVILAPFLNDSLRFLLMERLRQAGLQFYSHRPSRAIREEPVARAFITMLRLAYMHPQLPSKFDFARMLVQFIDELDPIRAELLTQIVYRSRLELGSFDAIKSKMQERITYQIGEQYESLRVWLDDFREEASQIPPDHFFARLFDRVSNVGFRLHHRLDNARIVAELMQSISDFRQVAAGDDVTDWRQVAHDYIDLVSEGILAAYRVRSRHDDELDAILIAPAYTFLMQNRAVSHQFWLNVGSSAWVERLEQPVTHPYVLREDYPVGVRWTDEQEMSQQARIMKNLIMGLVRRCKGQLYLGISDLSEQGYEQRGELLTLFNRILQRYQ